MRKQTNFLFYVLSAYVFLQFLWWGYHLIQLTQLTGPEGINVSRRVWMIVGEGSVFLLLLILGIWKIRSSIQREVQLSQRQSNFLLSVTHELKTPIASTKLFLQTLNKRNLSTEKLEEITEKALEENERLERLIENILNATRLENNLLSPTRENFQFSELANRIVNRYHKSVARSFISLNLKHDAELYADPFLIETILSNLIDNAIKYAGIDAKISLFSCGSNGKFTFGVSDEGPGISKNDKEQIFEKFFRSGNEETRTAKGSGLGLYIVKEYAALLNAELTFRNNIPNGCIFELIMAED
jgi:K+-sensing histidine kinase KdpD